MKKPQHAFVSRMGSSSLAGAIALLLAGGTAAQTPADAALEEITVTGTRIRATDGMAEPVPVTTLTVQELALFEHKRARLPMSHAIGTNSSLSSAILWPVSICSAQKARTTKRRPGLATPPRS